MRYIVIGAVAAGTSAAAKARRNDEDAKIVVYEKDRYISYSGCGMPYFLGGLVDDVTELVPRDTSFFKQKYDIDVRTLHEVISIDRETKSLQVQNLVSGETFVDRYDKLIIATGASPLQPNILGIEREHAFFLRNINDMLEIDQFIKKTQPQTALVIGSGYIGMEMCENLKVRGIDVVLAEQMPQVMPGLDQDMAVYVEQELQEHGVRVLTDCRVAEIQDSKAILTDGTQIPAELVLLATGVRPNTELAVQAGCTLGETGAIWVDRQMRTSQDDIYACGDCIEQFHRVTGKAVYRPLGSTANKTGRIAGDCLTGGNSKFDGVLGTGIFRLFRLTVAQTGLSKREAEASGYAVSVCHNIKPSRSEYLGGRELIIKAIADKKSGRILGAQVIGADGADKRVDVLATAISLEATAEDLVGLDLAYAPPFSTAKDPVNYTGMILDNAIAKNRPLITAEELDTMFNEEKPCCVIDARDERQYAADHLPNAESIPHGQLRQALDGKDRNATIVTYCNKGVTGNAAQSILLNRGFKTVYNLSGGHRHFRKQQKSGDK